MKIRVIISAFFLLLIAFAHAQPKTDSTQLLSIGERRVLKSQTLQESRVLNIYLPLGFDKSKSYPVMYVLDGSIHEDFLHIVGLTQFFHLQFKMPDCIVVGISNVDRKRDFTFHTDLKELKDEYPTTGYSEKFIQFLETELQPYIQNEFHTTGTNYLLGQSLGGLLATEILLKKPNMFSHYLIVSPSLWWDNESLLKQSKSLLAAQKTTNKVQYVYVSVGGKEAGIMKREAKKLANNLKQADFPNLKIDFLQLSKENHATILHQSINEAFKKLFPYKEE